MVTRLELQYRYDKYVEAFSTSNILSINDEDVDFPTKKSIQNDDVNIDIRNTSVNGSENLLISNNDRGTSIRYFPPRLLTWLPVKLTEVLKVNVCEDHEEFWWFTHDLARAYSERFGLIPEELVDNLELLIRLVLSEPMPGLSPSARRVNKILWESKTLASYLAFPTFEGFAKVACRHDIKMNGEIRDGRRIRELTPPNVWSFKTSEDGDGICSNIGMLLWHLESMVVRPRYTIRYRNMREAAADIFDHQSDRIYGLFNEFRNDSLHGRHRASREYGVLLNYISLIIWTSLFP